jgi:hypothetical protein
MEGLPSSFCRRGPSTSEQSRTVNVPMSIAIQTGVQFLSMAWRPSAEMVRATRARVEAARVQDRPTVNCDKARCVAEQSCTRGGEVRRRTSRHLNTGRTADHPTRDEERQSLWRSFRRKRCQWRTTRNSSARPPWEGPARIMSLIEVRSSQCAPPAGAVVGLVLRGSWRRIFPSNTRTPSPRVPT